MIKHKENPESGYWDVFLKDLRLVECMDEREALEICAKLKLWRKTEISEALVGYLNSPYRMGGGAVIIKTIERYAELITVNRGKGPVGVIGEITLVEGSKYKRLGLTVHEAIELTGINSTVAGIMATLSAQEKKDLSIMMAAMIDIERNK